MLWWTYQQLRISSAKTRLAVIQKLVDNHDPDAAGPLIFALEDKDPDVRAAAARGLMHFQDRRAIEPLIKMLHDYVSPVRAAAAETLGHLGDPGAVNHLVGFLRDPDHAVSSAAARSLNRLGWKPGSDSQRTMQLLAIGNLQQIVKLGPEGMGPLLELLRNGPVNKQFAAVKALAEINDPCICPAMIEALGKENTSVRIAALGALERLADPAAYPEVEKLLHDPDAHVRGAAIETAVHCGGARAVPALTACLKDASWEVRQAAANALGKIGERSAAEGLCGLINDPDRDVRESVIAALGQLCDRRAIVPLVLALLDTESTVRAAAAATLDKLDRHWKENEDIRQVVPKIFKALDSGEYWVRHSAVKLLELLNIDPENPPAEFSSAATAGETTPHPATAVLADMLFDHDRDFRLAAAVALGRLRDKSAGSVLAAAACDSDAAVCQAAQTALAALN
jgi:HEAT repeat protein